MQMYVNSGTKAEHKYEIQVHTSKFNRFSRNQTNFDPCVALSVCLIDYLVQLFLERWWRATIEELLYYSGG